MRDVWPDLKSFITDYCETNKIKSIAYISLNMQTSLDLDLGIFDITMDLFLTDFAAKFEIDSTGFNWTNHGGYPKDSFLIGLFRLVFGYKRGWTKKVLIFFYRPRLFVGDLQLAIITGKFI